MNLEWENSTLLDVCHKITDGTHDTPKPVKQGIPYITAIHVKEGFVDFGNCYYLPPEIHKTIYRRCNPERGDVLFVNIGAGTATPALVKHNFEFSLKNVALLKPDKTNLLGEYLESYLLFHKPRMFHRLTSGGAQPFFSLKAIGKLKIDLPPLAEQEKIAGILGCWDSGIERLEKLIAAKRKIKKGLMHQLLTGKKRFKDFEGQEWKEYILKKIFKRITRKNNRNVTHVLTISGQYGLVDQRDYFNRSVAGKDLSGYYLLEKGEFAYNRSLMKGYPFGAIKRLDDYDEGVLSTLYLCFAVDSCDVDSNFFMHYFEAGLLNKQLGGIAQMGARAHGLLNVTATDFFNMKAIIPSVKEQQRIASVLIAADNEIELLRDKLEALKNQKKGLMQKLLTGKIRVKV